MSAHDDLATVRRALDAKPTNPTRLRWEALGALSRVEEELERLTAYCESQDWHTEWYVPIKRRAEAAEAERDTYRQALEEIAKWPAAGKAQDRARAALRGEHEQIN